MQPAEIVVPVLLQTLIDLKYSARLAAQRALEDYWGSCPREVEGVLRDYGIYNSNYRIREECLNLIQKICDMNPSAPTFALIYKDILSLQNDPYEQVRTLAHKIALHNPSSSTNSTRSRAFRPANTTNASSTTSTFHAPTLTSRSNESDPFRGSDADNGQTQNVTQSNSTSGSTSLNSDLAELFENLIQTLPGYKLDAIEPQYVESEDDLLYQVDLMSPDFEGKETEFNWIKREKHVIEIRALLRGNAPGDFPDAMKTFLKMLTGAIGKAISSLRTTLSSHACQLVKDAAIIMGIQIDSLFDAFLVPLIKLTAATKKLAQQNAHMAICAVFANMGYRSRIMTQIDLTFQEKNVQPRLFCGTWLHILILAHRNKRKVLESTSGMKIIEKCITKGLVDANPSVREVMRSTYWALYEVWEDIGARLWDKCDLAAKKALEKSKPEHMNSLKETNDGAGKSAPAHATRVTRNVRRPQSGDPIINKRNPIGSNSRPISRVVPSRGPVPRAMSTQRSGRTSAPRPMSSQGSGRAPVPRPMYSQSSGRTPVPRPASSQMSRRTPDMGITSSRASTTTSEDRRVQSSLGMAQRDTRRQANFSNFKSSSHSASTTGRPKPSKSASFSARGSIDKTNPSDEIVQQAKSLLRQELYSKAEPQRVATPPIINTPVISFSSIFQGSDFEAKCNAISCLYLILLEQPIPNTSTIVDTTIPPPDLLVKGILAVITLRSELITRLMDSNVIMDSIRLFSLIVVMCILSILRPENISSANLMFKNVPANEIFECLLQLLTGIGSNIIFNEKDIIKLFTTKQQVDIFKHCLEWFEYMTTIRKWYLNDSTAFNTTTSKLLSVFNYSIDNQLDHQHFCIIKVLYEMNPDGFLKVLDTADHSTQNHITSKLGITHRQISSARSLGTPQTRGTTPRPKTSIGRVSFSSNASPRGPISPLPQVTEKGARNRPPSTPRTSKMGNVTPSGSPGARNLRKQVSHVSLASPRTGRTSRPTSPSSRHSSIPRANSRNRRASMPRSRTPSKNLVYPESPQLRPKSPSMIPLRVSPSRQHSPNPPVPTLFRTQTDPLTGEENVFIRREKERREKTFAIGDEADVLMDDMKESDLYEMTMINISIPDNQNMPYSITKSPIISPIHNTFEQRSNASIDAVMEDVRPESQRLREDVLSISNSETTTLDGNESKHTEIVDEKKSIESPSNHNESFDQIITESIEVMHQVDEDVDMLKEQDDLCDDLQRVKISMDPIESKDSKILSVNLNDVTNIPSKNKPNSISSSPFKNMSLFGKENINKGIIASNEKTTFKENANEFSVMEQFNNAGDYKNFNSEKDKTIYTWYQLELSQPDSDSLAEARLELSNIFYPQLLEQLSNKKIDPYGFRHILNLVHNAKGEGDINSLIKNDELAKLIDLLLEFLSTPEESDPEQINHGLLLLKQLLMQTPVSFADAQDKVWNAILLISTVVDISTFESVISPLSVAIEEIGLSLIDAFSPVKMLTFSISSYSTDNFDEINEARMRKLVYVLFMIQECLEKFRFSKTKVAELIAHLEFIRPICHIILECINDSEVQVRRQIVAIAVSLRKLFGDSNDVVNEMLKSLNEGQKRLVNYYFLKAMRSN